MAFCPNNNRPNNNLAIIQIMAFPRVSSSIMIKSHFSDRPIFQTRRSSRPHATVLGFPPQSRIPKLLSDKSKRQKRRKRNKCLQNIRQSAYSLLLAPNRPLQKKQKKISYLNATYPLAVSASQSQHSVSQLSVHTSVRLKCEFGCLSTTLAIRRSRRWNLGWRIHEELNGFSLAHDDRLALGAVSQ